MKEFWTDIKGFKGRYQVSNKTRVRSCPWGYWRILKCFSQPSGHINVRLQLNKKLYTLKLARLVYSCFKHTIPTGFEVDHINNKPTDNRLCNLRIATHYQNCANQKTQTRKKYSKYKGVSWSKEKNIWRAYIKVRQKYYHLGYCVNEKEAAVLYNKAARKYFNKFAKENII